MNPDEAYVNTYTIACTCGTNIARVPWGKLSGTPYGAFTTRCACGNIANVSWEVSQETGSPSWVSKKEPEDVLETPTATDDFWERYKNGD